MKLKAADSFPKITLPLVGGRTIELGKPRGDNNWQLVVVYRGLHCPLCLHYLARLEALRKSLKNLRVEIIAVSGDPEEKAEQLVRVSKLTLPVAYGLTLDDMREMGLYISPPRSAQENDRPNPEPAMFVIDEDGNLRLTDVSNNPFLRPDLDALSQGLEYIRGPANDYPIRGTLL